MAEPAAATDPQDGPFRINSRCIDCGTCWRWDPDHFAPGEGRARVRLQPIGEPQTRAALLALQACPVAAIEAPAALCRQLQQLAPEAGFPALIAQHPRGDALYCGWSSRHSYGAASWLLRRSAADGGNVLIDTPRWSAPLARRIAALGGLAAIVLTHRDDVADQARWARAFAAPRWIHSADADAAPDAEHQVRGEAARDLGGGLSLIPTPGHTAGSMVAVFGDDSDGPGQLLFSGDHLWWSPERQAVVASERYCWWDWPSQLRSVERLRDLDVRWLLPGHGHWQAFGPGQWHRQLNATLEWARGGAQELRASG